MKASPENTKWNAETVHVILWGKMH